MSRDPEDHARFMRRAIALSIEHMHANDGGPFGAVVVKDGEIVGEGWNQVTSTCDPTAHAEVVAIRRAATRLGCFALDGAVLYTSCEPCPMCLGAAWWARLARIYYANDRSDAAAIGFDDDVLYDEITKPIEQRTLVMERLLPEEAMEAFRQWEAKADKTAY